ncbi:glycosyltransferase family 4 protein [Ascidiimonas sp. W6]|uniref:glycosyltransferase family 4 protein n=1 Tax=Ascidiimonas meishanensis TaxID=3128903 RepID=UPI0030EEE852
MKEAKEILILSSEFPPQPGGIGNHAYNLAKQLQLQNCKVSVLVDNRSEAGEEEKVFDEACVFEVYRIPITRPRVLMYFSRIRKAFKLARNHKTIIVSGKFPIWLGAFIKLFYSVKIIAVVHGTEVNFKQTLLRKSIDAALARFPKIIAVSHHTKSLLTETNQLKSVVIPNGIDAQKFNQVKANKKELVGNPKLITVGNVTHRKGQLNVIRQLSDLATAFPEIHYHSVGIPSCKDEFLKEAIALGVEEKLTFHGALSDADLKGCLLESTIFVMLSSETDSGDIEGFGIALLEANYLGIPAIGAKNCGIEDAILEGKSGHLIVYNNTEAFIEAIQKITIAQESYQEEAIRWGNKHQWENVIHEYLKHLQN